MLYLTNEDKVVKANEVPEKVYIHKSQYWGLMANNENITKNGIEYTRTDAFIKKVEDYLNSQLYDWVNVTNPDQRSCANIILKKDFIEDFKNYMKED